MPTRPSKQKKRRPGKSPRTKKLVVGNIVLPNDPVTVPKPFVPSRQRGSLLGGAPMFASPYTKKKKKNRKNKKKGVTKRAAMPGSSKQQKIQQQQESDANLLPVSQHPLSTSPSKQPTSLTVVPSIPSTPSILFGKLPANMTTTEMTETETETETATTIDPANVVPRSNNEANNNNNNNNNGKNNYDAGDEEGGEEDAIAAAADGITTPQTCALVEEIGIPFGSPRLFHDYRNKQKAREVTATLRFEHDANLHEAQTLGSTVFFHSTGLQHSAMTNFSEEANERSERRIRYLQRLEEKMVKAVENDYRAMKKRVDVLSDQRNVRRALEKAQDLEDEWISDLRLKRKYDRQVHRSAMDGDVATRRKKATAEAERQRQTNAYIQRLKNLEIKKNRESRNKILQQRDDGTKRALEYKRNKLKVIQEEKDATKKKNRVKTVRRQRAIERNLKTHQEMTERISRLLEYRHMYNSEMKNVYDDLSSDVQELRMKQRARNVFGAGESPVTNVRRNVEVEY
jgi:hypothetical protein